MILLCMYHSIWNTLREWQIPWWHYICIITKCHWGALNMYRYHMPLGAFISNKIIYASLLFVSCAEIYFIMSIELLYIHRVIVYAASLLFISSALIYFYKVQRFIVYAASLLLIFSASIYFIMSIYLLCMLHHYCLFLVK